jgi:type IV pilus biogenesis/stability protein PilW
MFPARFASPNRLRSFSLAAALTLVSLGSLQGCSSASKSDPTHKTPRERAQLLVEAANGSLIEGDPIGALQYLSQAEKIDPDYSPVYHAKALAFAARKDFSQALVEMKHAVDLDPENPYALNTYGKFLIDAGRLDEAGAPLLKAGDNPTFRESYKANTNLGILYYRKGELDRSESRFQRAINDDPVNSCIAYYYKGHIALKRGQVAEAENQYRRATEKQCAAFADAHLALGMMYERQGKSDLARKKYIELDQNFPQAKASETARERLKKLP